MRSAQQLVTELASRRRQRPVANALLAVAQAGGLTRDHMCRLVRVEAQVHRVELPGYAVMGSRFPRRPAAGLYLDLSRLAYDAGPRLNRAGQALGLSSEDMAQWQPPTHKDAYDLNGILSWVAIQGSQAVTALVAYTDMCVYYPACQALVAEIRKRGVDAPGEFTSYFDSGPPEEMLELALDVVQDGLDRDDDPQEALFMARLLEQSLEGFWAAAAAA
ncbi:hypothetical protein [Streptomyces zagrosensis]|uniref:Uncharacterized protein n=1 Tax=Streptomyces zagrosensis TaxID=1042984 RepID=A0A7W9QA22_9ACTN|nr:hypothetical protein [Streptomyces zagrosensis]MBB5936416.1 hypothetical protein [Streptomyces zagrosensis]